MLVDAQASLSFQNTNMKKKKRLIRLIIIFKKELKGDH